MNSQTIHVGISIGELMDKITILEIKSTRISDPQKLQNVSRELRELAAVAETLELGSAELVHVDDLRVVNTLLWDVEDAIRECEYSNDFGDHFVKLARSVYKHNDLRADLKKKINQMTGSALVEEKSYSANPAARPT